jgi:Holliday junction DNA helicase RuvB
MMAMESKSFCGMRMYAEFELARFDITPDVRRVLEPLVLDALFEYAARQHTDGKMAEGMAQLTVSQALEVLSAQQPRWRERLHDWVSPLGLRAGGSPLEMGTRLHELLREAHLFFRREGAGTFRVAAAATTAEQRFNLLWADLFTRCVLDWLREEDMLGHVDKLETADMLVECMKLWARDLSLQLGQPGSKEIEPSLYFLDVESDLSTTFERGPIKLKVRGRPDALQLSHQSGGVSLFEYKFAEQDRMELRIAQVVLYMALVERVKGVPCANGSLLFFQPKWVPEDAPQDLPAEVETAFAGYWGNDVAVRRMKKGIARVRDKAPPRIVDNYLLSGVAGMGKTELARRMARALGVPFVPIRGSASLCGDSLLAGLDEAMNAAGLRPIAAKEEEAGKFVQEYPALLLYLDDVHEVRCRADQFLNLLEPQDRRIFGSERIARLSAATVVASTEDMAQLPEALQSRFRRIEFEMYRDDAVAKIVTAAGQRAGVDFHSTIALLLARMGRCNPRRATAYANDLCVMNAMAPANAPITRETVLLLGSRDWKVDEHGLSEKDYLYLRALESGPKGVPALQQLLLMEGDDFTRVIEPYLLHLGAIQRSTRGRALTVLGEQLLHRRTVSMM